MRPVKGSSSHLTILHVILLVYYDERHSGASTNFPYSRVLSTPGPFPAVSDRRTGDSDFVDGQSFEIPANGIGQLRNQIGQLSGPHCGFGTNSQDSIGEISDCLMIGDFLAYHLIPMVAQLRQFHVRSPYATACD